MSKAPKYSFRVVEKRNNTWTAEIQRQATAKKKVVSKRQTGFASEEQGVEWAEQELKQILANHIQRNKRHDEERAEQYQEKLKQKQLAIETAMATDDSDSNNSDSTADLATQDEPVEAKLTQTTENTVADLDDDANLVSKPKFDFEVELEEAEEAEKALKKKAKAKKKLVKQQVDDSELTVDGSEEVNDIYLKNKS